MKNIKGKTFDVISTPFYGILPFKLNGVWYWGRKVKTTYIITCDIGNRALAVPIKTAIY